MEYITTSNLYWDHFELKKLKSMYFKESEIDKCTVKKGDLLICEGGDIGRSAIWTFDYEIRIQNHIHKLRKYSELIYTDFYYYLLWLYKQTDRISGIGIGLQGFSSKRVIDPDTKTVCVVMLQVGRNDSMLSERRSA